MNEVYFRYFIENQHFIYSVDKTFQVINKWILIGLDPDATVFFPYAISS